MAECASKAEFFGPGGSSRTSARIFGAVSGGFKPGCGANDVQSMGYDEAGNSRGPTAVRRVISAHSLQIEAELAHGANWHETRMRAKCTDGSWSNWVTVKT